MYKAKFYFPAVFQHLFVPDALFRSQLWEKLSAIPTQDLQALLARANQYNRLDSPFDLPDSALTLPGLKPTKNSGYYYDLRKTLCHFPPGFRFERIFGDVTHIPPHPTFVKTRPIEGDNRNSVLLKFDSARHFRVLKDTIPFDEKEPKLVWRGQAFQVWRYEAIRKFWDHPLCDIGHVNPENEELPKECCKPRMSMAGQLKYKFILSMEGWDVASNLKWVAQSNSLCFMPKPKFESWFLERQLGPGVHYVQVRDDFSDIPEKVSHYTTHPEEAKAIIRNFQAYHQSFTNPRHELLAGLLTVAKYFHFSGQTDLSRVLPAHIHQPLLGN
jgi:hypothetical protein